MARIEARRGSLAGYGNGCRCVQCTAAMDKAHGTQSGYVHGKCRCDECTEVQRRYDAEIYARNSSKILERKRQQYSAESDAINKRRRSRRAINSETAREKDREYYAANRELKAQRKRQSRAADPERVRKSRREWIARTGKGRVYSAERRARIRNVFMEHVDPVVVFERDGYICQNCGIQCPTEAKWPQREAATLDHIIPLARGGEHSYANMQTLCFKCNTSKGARHNETPDPLVTREGRTTLSASLTVTSKLEGEESWLVIQP